ncbi:MAG: DUF1501 domain-containing protein [Chloroflexi bacterium]|nr:DUF1501 domain-containing protein [Chloroflexota bacterium]
MDVTRRSFLKVGVTMVGAGAILPPVFRKTLGALSAQRVHAAPVDDGRVLVVVQMAGGNDGLNTVIPISDSRYYNARPRIAVPADQALSLDADTGLHPVMTGMKGIWDSGNLAIVEGVEYPRPNFSHFTSMDIWQSADPNLKLTDGWVGRYFAAAGGSQPAPFLGLAVGSDLPKSMWTPTVAVPALPSIAQYQFQGDPRVPALTTPRTQALSTLCDAGRTDGAYGPLLSATMRTATASIQTLTTATQQYKPAVTYPNKGLANALLLVAQTIGANVGVKVCHVSIGGFDTHATQATAQPRQLAELSDSLAAFHADLKAHQLDSKVLIMTWSEFGRRVNDNASDGTDHGTAGPLFFLGTPVKGGRYGQRPDLGNLDNGNLRYTTDFRSVYATAIEGWLGAPSKAILGEKFELLPLLR